MNRPLRSALATILSAAVLATSPGLPAARAVAAGFTVPRGGAAVPQLRTVVGGLNLGTYEGKTSSGVDLHGLFTALRAADLSTPAGLRLAAPLLSRLPDGRADSEAAVVFAALSAATEIEKRAAALSDEAKKAVGSGAGLPGLESRMTELEGLYAYMSLGARVRFVGARESVADALLALRQDSARGIVRDGTQDWEQREPETVAAPASAARPFSSGLTRRGMVAVLEARRAAVAAPAPAPAKKTTFLGRAAWPVALALTAGVGAGLAATSLGAAPVLLIAGFLGASILAHEWAHLLVLNRLGDDTARLHGASLNPFKQMDPWGTVLVPVLSLAASLPFFGLPVAAGWAKAVPVDFNKLPNPKVDAAKVALAGPAANLLLAGLAFAALPFAPAGGALAVALAVAWKANLALAAFNLLPLPQLDGGKLVVALMPQALYDKWTASPNLPAGYQKSYTRLFEGPAALLSWFGLSEQGRTNRVTRLVTIGVMAAFFVGATVFFKLPLLLLLLVCSYDYYCVREKIQNEAAVQDLIVILQGFAGELAQLAADDPLVKSEVDVEEAEHALKNALEDTIDKVVDSEGFESLSADAKWDRLKDAYMGAAVDSLKAKTMAADDAATIRRLLESPAGQAYLDKIKGWVERWEVFAKWHSPKRKAKSTDSLRDAVKDTPKAFGAGKAPLALLAVGALGASMAGDLGTGVALGMAAFGMGVLAPENKPKTFFETLDEPDYKVAPKEKQFLSLMLAEMKLQDKPPVAGRLKEMHEVVKTVTAPRGVINSVVLVGKSGTGKTAVVEKLAQSIALAERPGSPETFGLSSMKGKFLVKLNLPRLLQQEQPAAALDALLTTLARLNDADKRKGSRVVLFVDEIAQLFQHPQGALMANALKEPLRDGELTIIAATTEAEYKEYMEKDAAFRRRLIKVDVAESSVDETLRALRGAKSWHEHLYGATIPDETLQAAAELSKYDQEEFLPGRAFLYARLAANNASYDAQRDRLGSAIADRIGELEYEAGRLSKSLAGTPLVTQKLKEDEPDAIDLYNRVVALTRELVELYAQRAAVPAEGVPVVTPDMVKAEIAGRTGVASGQLSLGREPMEKYLEMEERMGKRVVGQNEAVELIANAVRQNKAGLSDPNKPLGTFYLTGPTGVGKTHLAKELARFMFDDPNAVTRLDMSEYMESHSVARLVGAPPGYVGYGQGGQLTEAVRKRPYGVLLLDEIEKAHSDVWLMLLQITGDGRLTDGEGRTVSFKNTIILMTSNLGMSLVDTKPFEAEYKVLKTALDSAQDGPAREIVKAKMKELAARLGAATKAQAKTITEEAFRATYPPEFAGRLSAPPIVFNRIDPDMALKIVDLKLAELRAILAHAGHEFEWTPAATEALVHEGFDIVLGARPLANAIDRLITQPLAKKILESYASGAAGARAIKVDAKNGGLSLDLSPITPKAASKAHVEGAVQELFSRVLDAALKAASASATPELALETVDAWARGAAGLLVPAEKGPDAPSARASAPAGLYAPGAAPVAPESMTSATAEHNDPARKDPAFAAARKAAAGTDTWNDFLKVFGDQAKRMSLENAEPVVFAHGRGETSAVATFTRRGSMGAKEKALLQAHFGGPAPVDAAQARDKAEALNVMGQDGRRLMFDLHRALAAVPGARLGWSEVPGSVTYWLELPIVAAPAPAPAAPIVEPVVPTPAPAPAPPASVNPPADAAERRASLPVPTPVGVVTTPRATAGAGKITADASVTPRKLHVELDGQDSDAQLRWYRLVSRLNLPSGWRRVTPQNGVYVLDAASPRAAARFAERLAADDAVRAVRVSPQSRRLVGAAPPGAPPGAPPETAQADDARPILNADIRIATAHEKVWGVPHDYMAGPAAPETVWFRLTPGLSAEAREAAAAELIGRAGLARQTHAGAAHEFLAAGQDGRSAIRGALVLAGDARVVEVVIDEPAVPLVAEALAQPELPLAPQAAAPARAAVGDDGRIGKFDLNGGELTPNQVELRFFPAQTVTAINQMMLTYGVPDGAVRRRGNGLLLMLDAGRPENARRLALAFGQDSRVSRVRLHAAHREPLSRALPPDTPGIARIELQIPPGPRMTSSRLFAGSGGVEFAARRELADALRAARLTTEAQEATERVLNVLRRAMTGDERPVELAWSVEEDRVRIRSSAALPAAFVDRLAPLVSGELARDLALLNARVLWHYGIADMGGVWLEMMPRRDPPEPAPEVSAELPEWRPGEGARGRAVEFARALLAQGDVRGPTLRMSAAEALAALSTPDDLPAARQWAGSRAVSRRYPEIAAGALTVARHGASRSDLDVLKGAAYRLSAHGFDGHAYNAVKSRVSEAVARLLGRAAPRGRSRLPDLYREEESKEAASHVLRHPDESRFGVHRSEVLLDAYYEAMALYGDEDATDLLLQEWTQKRVPLLYEHLARVAPERLDAVLARGRALLAAGRAPDGADRLLLLYALAERGAVEETQVLLSIVTDGWRGALDGQTKPLAGEALARAAARGPRAAAVILPAVRPWLRSHLGDGANFSRVVAAVQAVGAAGDASDLAELERIVRVDPGAVSFEHEMTQHEAALAWARVAVRTGAARDLLTRAPAGGGLPPLLAMLADRSAVVNKAAMEALKLLLTPRQAARAPLPETSGVPSLPAGVIPPAPAPTDAARRLHDRPSTAGGGAQTILELESRERLDSPGYEPVGRLDAAARGLHWTMATALKAALEAVAGTPFAGPALTFRTESESFTWTVREAAPRLFDAPAVAGLREYLSLLLYWTTLDGATAGARAGELETRIPGTVALLRALSAVVAAGGRVGLDHEPGRAGAHGRGALEVWWSSTTPAPPPRR